MSHRFVRIVVSLALMAFLVAWGVLAGMMLGDSVEHGDRLGGSYSIGFVGGFGLLWMLVIGAAILPMTSLGLFALRKHVPQNNQADSRNVSLFLIILNMIASWATIFAIANIRLAFSCCSV